MHALIVADARTTAGAAVAARRIAGLSMLERAVLVARDAGVRVAVVLADRSRHAALGASVRRRDLGVELSYADPATGRDGILAALPSDADAPVVVVRADVVHGRAASARLRDAAGGGRGVILVDSEARSVRDADRMLLRETGSAPWIGLARVTVSAAVSVVDGLRMDPDRGDRDALALEIAAGRAVEVEAPEVPWQPVRDDEDARAARRRLFRSLGKPQDGIVSRWMNRPISTSVSRLLVGLPVHPNVMTVIVFLMSLAGCALVALGDAYWWPLIGTATVHVASILDGCDGELARLRYQQSLLGAWLDTVSDEITTLLFAASAGVNIWRFEHSWPLAVVGVATLVCGGIAMYLAYSYIAAIGSGNSQDFPSGVKRATVATSAFSKVIGFLAYLPKRDTMNFAMLACAAAGSLEMCQLLVFAGAAIMSVVFTRQYLGMKAAGTWPRGPAAARAGACKPGAPARTPRANAVSLRG